MPTEYGSQARSGVQNSPNESFGDAVPPAANAQRLLSALGEKITVWIDNILLFEEPLD
jgi:hypothetical protein